MVRNDSFVWDVTFLNEIVLWMLKDHHTGDHKIGVTGYNTKNGSVSSTHFRAMLIKLQRNCSKRNFIN